MIEITQCRNCRRSYEIIWNDETVNAYTDDFEDEDDDVEDDDCNDPVYCPFCGNHCDFVDE